MGSTEENLTYDAFGGEKRRAAETTTAVAGRSAARVCNAGAEYNRGTEWRRRKQNT